jgi:hypothetical protein
MEGDALRGFDGHGHDCIAVFIGAYPVNTFLYCIDASHVFGKSTCENPSPFVLSNAVFEATGILKKKNLRSKLARLNSFKERCLLLDMYESKKGALKKRRFRREDYESSIERTVTRLMTQIGRILLDSRQEPLLVIYAMKAEPKPVACRKIWKRIVKELKKLGPSVKPLKPPGQPWREGRRRWVAAVRKAIHPDDC